MAYDVFISYAATDKAVADRVCERLEAGGLRCWVAPRDILPGREWASSIVDAIESVEAFVLVFSSHSNNSHNVRREVELAIAAGAIVVPLRIEDVEPSGSLRYYIGDAHWLDALAPPLETHIDTLAEKLSLLMRRSGPDGQPVVETPATPVATPTAVLPVATPPATEPPSEPPPPRHRRPRPLSVLAGALGTIVVLALLGWFLSDRGGRSPAAACEEGVRWEQHTSPYLDGTVVRNGDRVGIIEGGAIIGFPGPDEFRALGIVTTPMEIAASAYDAIDSVPHDGTVLRERALDGGPGRVYYAAGGAVFQIRQESALQAISAEPSTIVLSPSHGLDGARRIPKSGTLLQVGRSGPIWLVDGGARRRVTNVCPNAHVNLLPADPAALAEIPEGGASRVDGG